jgi:hypothetical protein
MTLAWKTNPPPDGAYFDHGAWFAAFIVGNKVAVKFLADCLKNPPTDVDSWSADRLSGAGLRVLSRKPLTCNDILKEQPMPDQSTASIFDAIGAGEASKKPGQVVDAITDLLKSELPTVGGAIGERAARALGPVLLILLVTYWPLGISEQDKADLLTGLKDAIKAETAPFLAPWVDKCRPLLAKLLRIQRGEPEPTANVSMEDRLAAAIVKAMGK